jgi:hypothetical protein
MSGNNIFRKSSLERVSSPEQLNEYIKVSRPSVWLILGAVIILLIGVCVWGVFGTLTSTKHGVMVVQGNKADCYVSVEEAKAITPGMEVKVVSSVGTITAVASAPMEITDDFDAYALYLSGLKMGDWVVLMNVDISVSDGAYMDVIITESISPISFVLN